MNFKQSMLENEEKLKQLQTPPNKPVNTRFYFGVSPISPETQQLNQQNVYLEKIQINSQNP